jgi:gliding motility-associated-like protein
VVNSPLKEFDVPFPLQAAIGAISKSFPDVPTGTVVVESFTGGLRPYEVRIELDSATSLAFPIYDRPFQAPVLDSVKGFVKHYSDAPPGRYTVQVRDSVGCAIELIARIPMDVDLTIPNVMTPNEDGVNDAFYIRNLPASTTNKLVITNRWGKEIYSSANYQNDWTAEGTADGVYFYRLQIEGASAITGWVEIMRGEKP